MRVFIAFPVDEKTKKECKRIQAECGRWNSRLPIKWVSPDDLHITLQFLGDLNEDQIKKVKEILNSEISNSEPFSYRLVGITAFPALHKPKVIAMKVHENGEGSLDLYDKIFHKFLENDLLSEDRLWKPHITLGKIKLQKPARLKNIEEIDVPQINFEIKQVQLIASELTDTKPVYTVLESFDLKK